MVVARGGSVTAWADVVEAVSLKVGLAATVVTGQDSGPGSIMGGARHWIWDGGGGTLLRDIFTFHKGSSDPDSKSR